MIAQRIHLMHGDAGRLDLYFMAPHILPESCLLLAVACRAVFHVHVVSWWAMCWNWCWMHGTLQVWGDEPFSDTLMAPLPYLLSRERGGRCV